MWWWNTNKLKGISKCYSRSIKIEEYYNCLFGGEYQKECDNYNSTSINHQMYLEKLKKSSVSILDDERCYESINKSKP